LYFTPFPEIVSRTQCSSYISPYVHSIKLFRILKYLRRYSGIFSNSKWRCLISFSDDVTGSVCHPTQSLDHPVGLPGLRYRNGRLEHDARARVLGRHQTLGGLRRGLRHRGHCILSRVCCRWILQIYNLLLIFFKYFSKMKPRHQQN